MTGMLAFLRALLALVDTVAAVEELRDRQRRHGGRLTELERQADDVEALVQEMNIGPSARTLRAHRRGAG